MRPILVCNLMNSFAKDTQIRFLFDSLFNRNSSNWSSSNNSNVLHSHQLIVICTLFHATRTVEPPSHCSISTDQWRFRVQANNNVGTTWTISFSTPPSSSSSRDTIRTNKNRHVINSGSQYNYAVVETEHEEEQKNENEAPLKWRRFNIESSTKWKEMNHERFNNSLRTRSRDSSLPVLWMRWGGMMMVIQTDCHNYADQRGAINPAIHPLVQVFGIQEPLEWILLLLWRLRGLYRHRHIDCR